MAASILIVEDEAELAEVLRYNLEQAGYRVQHSATGRGALELVGRDPPDLVILDLMLPDVSGTEVCRTLRHDPAARAIPVLMLTAAGAEIDRVVGFEVGADDYMVKPFSMRELLLRVAAILRRAQPGAPERQPVEAGPIRVDREAHRVWVEGHEVTLTPLEFRLLATLLARRGRVQSREVLLEDVWGVSGEITTRTVDTHIKRLREKLGPAARMVETVRGIGYRYADGDGAPLDDSE